MPQPVRVDPIAPALAPAHLASNLDRAVLAEALGVADGAILDPLYAHGLRAATAFVLEWLPAVDVCWLDGAEAGERNALRVQLAADGRGTVEGLTLLDTWLTTRPAPEFFEAGRWAIRMRLLGLDEDAREATLDRIVAMCEAAGRAGGADFGVSALSGKERRHIGRIRRDLERSA